MRKHLRWEYKFYFMYKKDGSVIKNITIYLLVVIKSLYLCNTFKLNKPAVCSITTIDFYFYYEEIIK